MTTDAYWLEHAVTLASRNVEAGGGPFGALIVAGDEILGTGVNRVTRDNDPTAHAEILALRDAGQRLGNYRFPGSTLYATLEPCVMCAGAIVHARLARVVFAAADPKTGAAGSVFDTLLSDRHNHRVDVQGGLLADEAGDLLRTFFASRR